MKTIQTYIKQKYYIYQRGEFFPVYSNNELINKRAFHLYKAKRTLQHIAYYFRAVIYEIKQAQH